MWQFLAAVTSHTTSVDWVLLALGVLLLIYIAGTWKYDYFQKQGLASTKPKLPFLGDNLSLFFGFRSFPDIIKDHYNNSNGHAVYGMFEFTKPVFMICDPELLKVVAVKEFDNFMNHRTVQSEKADPIFSKNLLNLKDQAWRDMRATLSPAFTTSKIKGMFPLVSQCAAQMALHLRQEHAGSREGSMKQPLPTDMKNLFTRLGSDVIATVAFGVSCDSLKEPHNKFYKMGKKLTTFTKAESLKFLAYLLFPKLMEALGTRLLSGKATDFFDSLVHETIRERQKKHIFRPDMLQLLMQAREGQLNTEDTVEAEELGAKKTSGALKRLADEDMSAQAIIFFFAGFETVSTALCMTTHALSHNSEVMKQLQMEIDAVMEETGGKPNYETVQKMKYLEAVINEALRMYPPAVATDRICVKDIQLSGGSNPTPFIVHKGSIISIPIIGLHYDPQYWDEPEKFNPDRFNEHKNRIKPFTFMPFGVGPRICIGQRFALIEIKLVLVHLLYNFDLHPSSKTKHPLEYEPGINMIARGGFWCELTPRKL